MSQSMPYLGIKITTPTSSIYKKKFLALLETIKEDLHHIFSYKLSWLSRIAALKMLLLPKIIYFFRTIPITILEAFFLTQPTNSSDNTFGGVKWREYHSQFYKDTDIIEELAFLYYVVIT